MEWWDVVVILSLMIVVLYGIVVAVASAIGKDVWPYTDGGPLNSSKQAAWIRDACEEYAKKVPFPGRNSNASG